MTPPFQIELVWNREFTWSKYQQPINNLDNAIVLVQRAEASGDGDRVKKTRILDQAGNVVWQYGKKIQ